MSVGEPMRTLPAGHPSLARGFASPPGTLVVLGLTGGVLVPPSATDPVTFGRNTAEVTVPLGEDDRRVSRRHGVLEHHGGRWWVRATGKVPLRLPRSRLLFTGASPVPLPPGYLPVFARGSGDREHVLEVRITDGAPDAAPAVWLRPDERLVLAMVGRSFLRRDECPRAVPVALAAARLSTLDPGGGWTPDAVAGVLDGVRARVRPGRPDAEVVSALVSGAVLVPPDLALLAPVLPPLPGEVEWMPSTWGG
ncbi:FHA domain-containing protein [Amycolatopsis jejuensis]|uniref:FHA domain-containing protein n=1 Tax=Amycolatopsis jejuensis TaxID=330084 RepID=UPI0012E04A95|nr:FHA domain-containing protein [Amycolatopsis jejuensis]